jgi:hypothetical protein
MHIIRMRANNRLTSGYCFHENYTTSHRNVIHVRLMRTVMKKGGTNEPANRINHITNLPSFEV